MATKSVGLLLMGWVMGLLGGFISFAGTQLAWLGAVIAAQLGAMQMTQEIDAMQVMGVDRFD